MSETYFWVAALLDQVLNLDLGQILKLGAFRECPRQKYSTPSLPLTIPELVAAYPDLRIDYCKSKALQGLQLWLWLWLWLWLLGCSAAVGSRPPLFSRSVANAAPTRWRRFH